MDKDVLEQPATQGLGLVSERHFKLSKNEERKKDKVTDFRMVKVKQPGNCASIN